MTIVYAFCRQPGRWSKAYLRQTAELEHYRDSRHLIDDFLA